MARGLGRQAWAEIDLGALRENVALLADHVAPAALCAVVKAGAYGHGAVPVARAAVAAGARCLAVAVVDEGVELRANGIDVPVLVLAEVPSGSPDVADELVWAGLLATVASREGLAVLVEAAERFRAPSDDGAAVGVHVKIDTGMHRLGVAPGAARALVDAVEAEPSMRLDGVWTHLAVADGASAEDRAFTETQLDDFELGVGALGSRPSRLHAANTAGALVSRRARYDMVRCGIGVYGISPLAERSGEGSLDGVGGSGGDDWERGSEVAGRLRPVLSLRARVSAVRELAAGERPSYGRHRPMPERGVVATVPLGYADGVRRALFGGGAEVLIHGRRRPLAGMVTMDQLVVDCGPDGDVAVGDEVTLIGRQGTEEVKAEEWARRSGTISYEVVTGIGPRVPRILVDTAPANGAAGADDAAGLGPRREGGR